MPKKKTITEFLDGKLKYGNLYVYFNALTIYMRIYPVYIDGVKNKAITVANIANKNRTQNVFQLPKCKIRRTGEFAEFLNFIERNAKDRDFDGIYIENVLNEFLPDVLKRAGYKQVNIYHEGNPPCFWKQV